MTWGGRPRRGAARAAAVVIAAASLATLAGCATEVARQAPELRRDTAKVPRIVVMPFDVELSQLTAGGLAEPQAEWTDAALRHMRAALDAEAKVRNVTLVEFESERGTPADRETSLDLVKLHRAVGGAVMLHQYLGQTLPGKDGKFDWSLGPSVAAISRAHDADYALFLFVRDSYASAGRVAVIIVGALLGIGVPGGAQVGFASVVDLKTGDIVWFNRLIRGYGDLRTPDAAAETVKALVSDSFK
jgi:hypothetical protein